MNFSARLRLAMRANAIGALRLSEELSWNISASRIGDLADTCDAPEESEVILLSATLNVPRDWLAGASKKIPRKISDFCMSNGISLAAFNGELNDEAIRYIETLLSK